MATVVAPVFGVAAVVRPSARRGFTSELARARREQAAADAATTEGVPRARIAEGLGGPESDDDDDVFTSGEDDAHVARR